MQQIKRIDMQSFAEMLATIRVGCLPLFKVTKR